MTVEMFDVGLCALYIMICPHAYGGQGMNHECLNEKCPLSLIYLNVCCPVTGNICEGLNNRALMEEVNH